MVEEVEEEGVGIPLQQAADYISLSKGLAQ